MMLPPDEFDHADFKRYHVPRGTCPRCGSNDIRHLIIGLPAGPEPVNSTPEWVDWVGCAHPGHDRECNHCEFQWTENPPVSVDQPQPQPRPASRVPLKRRIPR